MEESYSSRSSQSINTGSSADVRIGRRNINGSDRHWNGQLDDIRIYDKALSATEIMDLYLQGQQ